MRSWQQVAVSPGITAWNLDGTAGFGKAEDLLVAGGDETGHLLAGDATSTEPAGSPELTPKTDSQGQAGNL